MIKQLMEQLPTMLPKLLMIMLAVYGSLALIFISLKLLVRWCAKDDRRKN